jgi:hypothetical protein
MGHLAALDRLEDLDISNTLVTDAGLVNLKGMNRMRKLNLDVHFVNS